MPKPAVNRQRMMAELPMGRLLCKMSIPLMISMLIQSLYNIVDTFFVAKLGIAAISAVGIAFPIQMLMIAASNGLCAGMSSLTAQRFGRGESDRTGRAPGNAIVMMAIISLIFILFGLFGSGAYLRASNDDAQIITLGVEYLRIVSIGCSGLFYLILCERLLQVTGNSTLSMLTQLFGAIVNIILDPILIFGYFGLPAMGVAGAAWATVIGQFLALALGLCLHLRINHTLKIRRSDLRLNEDAKTILRIGLPITLTMAMGSVMVFCMNRLLAPFAQALAVFSIYFKLQSFFFMPVAGLVQGLNPVIGFNYGARDGKRLREAIRLSLWATLGILLLGLLICQLIPAAIIAPFDDGSSPGLAALGERVIRIVSWTFPLAGLSMVGSNLFQGMGTGLPALLYGLCRQCILLIPAAALILHFFGADYVWFAFWVTELGTSLLVLILFRREYRKRVSPLLAQTNQA